MSESTLFNIYLNPLSFPELDFPEFKFKKQLPDYEAFLRFLNNTKAEGNENPLQIDFESFINRYHEIKENIFAVPAEDNIMNKIVWPLKNAKACFMLGNYLGTIALCGMVAEMMTVLMFEIFDYSKNGEVKIAVKSLFDTKFEKLGQEKRIRVLLTYGVIEESVKDKFENIRKKRNRYLHLFSEDHTKISLDAKEVYKDITFVVKQLFCNKIENGKIILHPNVIKFLIYKGLQAT